MIRPNLRRLPRFILALAALLPVVHAEETDPRFPHPERIRYDSQCLTIEGKDTFLYSGAFHYFRCPKELWRDRFETIKKAGFNCVDTYVPWNLHEPEMPSGLDDFSKVDLSDLKEWLKMAEEFGFYIMIRPGPYICAEWDAGGFPQWLLTKKPANHTGGLWLRSDEPTFIAWSKHWIKAVCPVIAPHQITRKKPGEPGVILFQVENEYDFMGNAGNVFSDKQKVNHLKALAQTAMQGGIDVPLFTCWTRQVRGSTDPVLRRIFDTCNFYPRWNVGGELSKKLPQLRKTQPNAPLMVAEMQGGWFSGIGGKLSEENDGVDAKQINNLVLYGLQHGLTGINYYMLFGGTHFNNMGGRDLTTSYDYNAPIREWGGVGDRYQQVRAIGLMLQEHGGRLARAEGIGCEAKTSKADVQVTARRAQDGSLYLFVRTSQYTEPRKGLANVKVGDANITFDYELGPFGSKILYLPQGVTDARHGEWLPKPAPVIKRPDSLPVAVEIKSARRRNDPGPSNLTKVASGASLAEAAVYDSDFVFYRTRNAGDRQHPNLLLEFNGHDAVVTQVGQTLAPRVSGAGGNPVFDVGGSGSALLLYENRGHAHFARDFEFHNGITSASFIRSNLGDDQAIKNWEMMEIGSAEDRVEVIPGHEVVTTKVRPEVRPDFAGGDWKPVNVDMPDASQLRKNSTAVFRAKFSLGKDDMEQGGLEVRLGRVDDRGWVYVNGKLAGEATDWSKEQVFDVTKQAQVGENLIAVVIRNADGNGGLSKPSLAVGAQIPAELALGRPAGVEQQWWKPGLDDTGWETTTIGGQSAPAPSALTWYRMEFSLPDPKKGEWVPWHVRLHATGNGFLYLNGHALGRYWEAGPQHDFFLPECWLNFGTGEKNQLTLSLRPLERGAGIQSVVVEPYRDFAEKR
jgi:hypothetical protein